MIERPILFSSAMVRAILAGTKRQTRRIVKLRDDYIFQIDRAEPTPHVPGWSFFAPGDSGRQLHGVRCPYGVPSDRLWVRESWRHGTAPNDPSPGMATFEYGPDWPLDARGSVLHPDAPKDSDSWCRMWRKRPSIHMPRWASRITLEVTSVRIERLQDISAVDILAEGAVDRPHRVEGLSGDCPVSAFDGKVYPDLRSLWAAGWDSINAERASWASNPYVWVVSFRRVEEAGRR